MLVFLATDGKELATDDTQAVVVENPGARRDSNEKSAPVKLTSYKNTQPC